MYIIYSVRKILKNVLQTEGVILHKKFEIQEKVQGKKLVNV